MVEVETEAEMRVGLGGNNVSKLAEAAASF